MDVRYKEIFDEIERYIDQQEFDGWIDDLTETLKPFTHITSLNLAQIFRIAGDALTIIDDMLEHLVLVMEKISLDMDNWDEDKREVLIKFLDDKIKLPWYLEWIDDNVIGDLVDGAVEYWNKSIGHDWRDY